MSEKEISWLHALSEGDTTSFTNIYQRYWKRLFLSALNVLNDRITAEDIIQDTFVSLWNNRHKAREIKSLQAYLTTSVRNACIKHIERHINRYNFVELLPEILEKLWTESNALSNLYLQEIENCIEKSIQEMPPKMQKVFQLSRIEQMSRLEIAEELNISVETVKKHLHNALHIVKNNLHKLDSYAKAILIFYLLWQK